VSTAHGFGHHCRRKWQVGPVTRTVDILAYFMIALLGLTLADSKIKGDVLSREGPLCVCHLFSSVSLMIIMLFDFLML